MLVLNIVLIVLSLVQKKMDKVTTVLLITAGGFILGGYNVFVLLTRMGSESGRQLSYFYWIVYSHRPVFNVASLLTATTMLIFWIKKKIDPNHTALFWSFILAGWIVLNEQVITGRLVLEAGHYVYFIVPTSLIIIFYFLNDLLKNRDKTRIVCVCLMIFVAFSNTALGQHRALLTRLDEKLYRQNYRPIIDVLNRPDLKKGVIFTGADHYAYLFTIYTSHDIFWNPGFFVVNVPMDKVKNALFLYVYMDSRGRNNFRGFMEKALESKDNYHISSLYRETYEDFEGYNSGLTSDEYYDKLNNKDPNVYKKRQELLAQLSTEYASFADHSSLPSSLMDKYGIDYIVWDKSLYPWWDLSAMNNIHLLASHTNIYLYAITR